MYREYKYAAEQNELDDGLAELDDIAEQDSLTMVEDHDPLTMVEDDISIPEPEDIK